MLKIHTETSKKYVDSKLPYLNKFLLLSYSIPTALTSNIPLNKLAGIMQKERRSDYASGTRRSISVELVIQQGNSLVDYKGGSLNLNSLTSCIEYLRKLGFIIKRDTLSKYIKNETVSKHLFYVNILIKFYLIIWNK